MVNSLLTPGWPHIREALARALGAYPEAAAAVSPALLRPRSRDASPEGTVLPLDLARMLDRAALLEAQGSCRIRG